MPDKATDVLLRFEAEQLNIRAFVSVTSEFMMPSDSTLSQITAALEAVGIKEFFTRDIERWTEPFSNEEFQQLIDLMSQFEPQINKRIQELEDSLVYSDPHWDELEGIIGDEHAQNQFEWIDYMDEHVPLSASSELQTEWVNRFFKDYIKSVEETENSDDEIKRYIRYVVELSINGRNHQKMSRLEEVLAIFTRLRIAFKMQNPHAEVNILRQGFLLLMTAFDAAIFDIFRVAMHSHFFQIIPLFSKKDSIPVAQWAKFSDFDRFRNKMIDRHLRGVYLRELLDRMGDIGFRSTQNSKDEDKLFEMILRRNLHVHNGGRVDEMYLKTDDDGTSHFNPYRLALGDIATIDAAYFEDVFRLTHEYVERLRDWVLDGATIDYVKLKQAKKRKQESN